MREKKVLFMVANIRVSNGVTSVVMNNYDKLIKDGYQVDFCAIYDRPSPYFDKLKECGSNYYLLPQKDDKPDEEKVYSFIEDIISKNNYTIVHNHILGRYGLMVWCMYLFVFMGCFISFIENRKALKERIKKFLTDHRINYKKMCTYIYYITILSLLISGVVLVKESIDSGNIKYIIGDRRTENNIISIDGVWGTISDDGVVENSAYPTLVREKNTPIYNLDKKTFSSSETTLKLFDEKIKNNNIYVLFDKRNETLEENEYVTALKKIDYEIISVEKIYTADEISYIDANTTWVLAKVKYVGE